MKWFGAFFLPMSVLLGAGAASAQTYDPSYPVCMHVYGEKIGERMDCLFTSLAQCAATASGLPATCLVNPYYPPPNSRRRAKSRG